MLTVGKRSVRLPGDWREERGEDGTVTYVDGSGSRYEDREAAMRAALFQKRASNELEPSEWLHLFDHYQQQGDVKEAFGEESAAVVTSSQYDDWLHRGDNPVLSELSLYLYSMWVYRVEKPESSSPEDFLFPFDESYPLKDAYAQRIAAEPRVPRIDGCQLFAVDSEVEREQAYKLLSVLLRPLRLPSDYANMETTPDIYSDCFDTTAPPGERFRAAWTTFIDSQKTDADDCFRACLEKGLWPNLWNTVEMHDLLQAKLRNVEPDVKRAMKEVKAAAVPLRQYLAFMTCRVSDNFRAIGYARLHKEVSQLKLDE